MNNDDIPRVIVSCPAQKCIYNKRVDNSFYCAGTPWIDMSVRSYNSPLRVECLDYVDGDELREEGIIQ